MTSNLATDKITNMTVAAWEDEEEIDMPELMEAIKPTLSAHFKPAAVGAHDDDPPTCRSRRRRWA